MKIRQVIPGNRQYLTGKLGKYDPNTRTVPILASTPKPVEGEALTAWDLSRFIKNPTVLWAHDQQGMRLPVGVAVDGSVEFDPNEGLKMVVRLARKESNPLAEEIANSLIDETVRAVSVGYDPPAEEVTEVEENGVKRAVKRRAAARLVEVSFVPVGMDEDAGTALVNPDAAEDEEMNEEELRAYISKAASTLGKARAYRARTRAIKKLSGQQEQRTDSGDREETVFRFDGSRLNSSKVQRTGFGGARIPANLTRTGVLEYRNRDGSIRRELRLPEEVFKADSLTTLNDVPVIDIKDHNRLHDPKSWKQVVLGHVTNVRQDGKYVASELVIGDADTLAMIDKGERTEISCGYRCSLEWRSGEHEGVKFDCIQRNIRYNHASLCPPNTGRAGSEVGLRLDSNTQSAWATAQIEDNEQGEQIMKVVRIDGKEYEVGSDAHISKLEELHAKALLAKDNEHKARVDALTAEITDLTKQRDEAKGKFDALTIEVNAERTDAKKAKDEEEGKKEEKAKKERARAKQRVRLVTALVRFFGGDDKEEEDEEKMDAKFDSLLDLSDRDLMIKAIKTVDAKFDAIDPDTKEPLSDDYVKAVFDQTLKGRKKARGVNGIRQAAQREGVNLGGGNLDSKGGGNGGGDEHPVEKARRERDQKMAEAGRSIPQNGGAK